MPSLVYNCALDALTRGNIDFARDRFKVLLVNGDYAPDKNIDSTRADIFGEVSGLGYMTGGAEVNVGISRTGDRIDITLGGADWPASSITARGAAYYKSSGELIAFVDFGSDVISTNGTFALTSSILRIQN